jgi:uncharacterized protein (TIRG00374 family)
MPESATAPQVTTGRAAIWRLLRLALGLGLLIWLVARIGLPELLGTLRAVRLIYPLMSVGLTAAIAALGVVRWRGLLTTQPGVGWRKLTGSYLVAAFFAQFLPAPTLGGDVVRVVDYSRTGGHAGRTAASVLAERGLGLLALLGLGLIAAALEPGVRSHTRLLALEAVLFVGVLGVLLLLLNRRAGEWALAWLRPLSRWPRIYGGLADMLATASAYRERPRRLAVAFGLSVAIQPLTILDFYIRALAFGAEVTLAQMAVAGPTLVVLAMIPLSPAAIGLQEGAYTIVLAAMGVSSSQAVSMSLLARLSAGCLALIGGLIYALRGGRRALPEDSVGQPD